MRRFKLSPERQVIVDKVKALFNEAIETMVTRLLKEEQKEVEDYVTEILNKYE